MALRKTIALDKGIGSLTSGEKAMGRMITITSDIVKQSKFRSLTIPIN